MRKTRLTALLGPATPDCRSKLGRICHRKYDWRGRINGNASFYRTADGSELDLVFKKGGTPFIGIEIKRSTAPKIGHGFTIACDDLKIEHRMVVSSGSEQYRTKANIDVHSLPSAIQRVTELLKGPFALSLMELCSARKSQKPSTISDSGFTSDRVKTSLEKNRINSADFSNLPKPTIPIGEFHSASACRNGWAATKESSFAQDLSTLQILGRCE
jgi:hypothetical protein